MSGHLTNSIQDYLKAIYELTQAGEPAATTALAKRLGVEPASVTGMVQKLATAKPALVNYRKHHGVQLTAAGKRAALEVIRHHRLLEAWLVKTLGYSWDEVHTEAERLEHVISEDFEERIATALGNPAWDPHGEPIPSSDLVMPSDGSVPLLTLKSLQKAIVRRVNYQDPKLLRYLEGQGLIPGVHLEVLEISAFDQIMKLKAGASVSPQFSVRQSPDVFSSKSRNNGGTMKTTATPLAKEDATVRSAHDVLSGKSKKGLVARLLPFLGPAFIASVAYMDPGNFATNIQGGAKFGYQLCGSSSQAT